MRVKLGNWALSTAQASGVVAVLEADEPVGQDAVGLPGQEGRAGAAAAVQVDGGLLADLVSRRSASRRSLVSSFLPEIAIARSATIGVPNRSVPATRRMYWPPCGSSARKVTRGPARSSASVASALAGDLALGDAGPRPSTCLTSAADSDSPIGWPCASVVPTSSGNDSPSR